MMYTKIHVIKIIREMIPGMGLREAKAVVDDYEMKMFENRVVNTLGGDAREELHTYARLFVAKEKDLVNRKVLSPQPKAAGNYDPCNCYDCMRAGSDVDVAGSKA